MEKWTVSSSSFSASASAATGAQVVELVISPTQGFSIEAKNFKIGKGSEVSTNKWVATGGVFWNADPNVESVIFQNRGGVDGVVDDSLVGHPSNTVKASVTLNSFTAPSASTTLYIDIDEREDNPIVTTGEEPRDVCLKVLWNYDENQTVTITGNAAVSSTDVVAGDASNQTEKKLSGTVPDGTTSLMATIKFLAEDGYYLVLPQVSFNIPSYNNGLYDGAFSITKSEVYASGTLVNEATYSIYYTPPVGFDDSVDAQGNNICALGHSLPINNIVVPIAVGSPNAGRVIHSIDYSSTANHVGGGHKIKVSGSVGSTYEVSVQKKTSTTSSVTAASNGYYNFATRAFQTAKTAHKATVGKQGVSSHEVLLPTVTSPARYDITLSGLVDGVQTTLTTGVPTLAGNAVIIQRGVNTLTITPITNTASNFGSLPADVTIVKPQQFIGSRLSIVKQGLVELAGGTDGSSSVSLKVPAERNYNIKPGMIVTGVGVAHNNTVVDYNKKYGIVTLAAVSTIANGTSIEFSNANSLTPFSFTVVPNASGDALSVTASPTGVTGGLRGVKSLVNGTAAKTVTHTLDSTLGIVPGMVVTGSQVAVDTGTSLKVASVTNGTTIVLDKIQTFIDNTGLNFTSGNVSGPIDLHSLQANTVGSNVVVTGYIRGSAINETAQVRIYIDNLITVA